MARGQSPVRVIAILGAESTGKSTLARDLHTTLGGVLVHEVLREFVTWHQRPPGQSEQLAIYRRQLGREVRARALSTSWVICDPSAAMTAIYSQTYFADTSLQSNARLLLSQAHRVLWCRPDIPWAADCGQRDGPGMRNLVDSALADFVGALTVLPSQVTGSTPQQRLTSALNALG